MKKSLSVSKSHTADLILFASMVVLVSALSCVGREFPQESDFLSRRFDSLQTYPRTYYGLYQGMEPWKRAPSAGWFGMRGKKVPNSNFFGMRGKKGPSGFLGMRGKKAADPNPQPTDTSNELFAPVDTFGNVWEDLLDERHSDPRLEERNLVKTNLGKINI